MGGLLPTFDFGRTIVGCFLVGGRVLCRTVPSLDVFVIFYILIEHYFSSKLRWFFASFADGGLMIGFVCRAYSLVLFFLACEYVGY